ncbi:Uncharacterised protein [uncultured Butyricicoccus sp.]|nr:Uncharacterised protein [uncultured Butyricicoccus sp.]
MAVRLIFPRSSRAEGGEANVEKSLSASDMRKRAAAYFIHKSVLTARLVPKRSEV